MRELSVCEISYVGGGPTEGGSSGNGSLGAPGVSTQVGNACNGLPNSADVTVSNTTGGYLGSGIGQSSSSTTVSATVNCGDYRSQNGGTSAPGGTVSGPYISNPVGQVDWRDILDKPI